MKTILLGTTILVALAAVASAAGINNIRIDATSNSGAVSTLAITQDAAALTNQVSGNVAGTTPFPVAGVWDTVSIDQGGATNKLYGSVKAGGGSSAASLTASYTGGANTHSLVIGDVTAPVDPVVDISVSNTGVGTNAITDTLNGTALTYHLAISGTGNTVTNSVAATGAVTLTQGGGGFGITGDNNTVSNAVAGVASFTHSLTLTGSGNTITNTASGGGDKTITQSIASDNNVVGMDLTGAGTQSAALISDSGSTLDFALTSAANNSAANIILSNVVGAAGTPAVVRITQTALADGATANLTVNGGIYTVGTTLAGGSGVYIHQNSANAYLNATVTAGANGYTVNFIQ